MIDTNKYEGHTPAPWVWMEWNTWLAGGNEDGFDGKFLVQRPIEVADEDKVDGLLIADAPLLLDFIVWVKDTHPHYYHKLTKAYQGAKNNR